MPRRLYDPALPLETPVTVKTKASPAKSKKQSARLKRFWRSNRNRFRRNYGRPAGGDPNVQKKGRFTMLILLIIVLLLVLGGGGGYYGHSRWGYGGGAGIGVGTILVVPPVAYMVGAFH